MEHVACDLCGGTALETVTQQTDILHKTTDEKFSIVCCKECGLHFLNPRPTRDEIGKFYSSEYSFHNQLPYWKKAIRSVLEFLTNSPFRYLLNFVPVLNRRLIPYIKPKISDPVRQFFQGGRILDIGCGSGISAHFWGESGALLSYRKFAEVHGVEVADRARENLSTNGVPCYKALDAVPTDLLFDIIRMNWSLEHVHSPAEYFRFISSRLTESGKAIVAVPNYGGLLYSLAKDCVEVPIHLYHFCKQDLINYADKFGLNLVSIQTFSYPQMFIYAASLCPSLKKSFAKPMGLSEAYGLQKVLSLFDASGLGNDMIVVLEKKRA